MKNSILCFICKKEFTSSFFCPSRTPKFCSRYCTAIGFRKRTKFIECLRCDKKFEVKHDNIQQKKYCSVKCLPGNPASLQNYPRYSFWKTATDDQKRERFIEIFEKKVIKQEGCWGWKSYIDSTGSGRIGPRSDLISSYRASWIIHKGPIPKNLLVLHKCNNRVCSNPDHLYLGTNQDNTNDMMRSGRSNFSKQKSKNAKLDREKAYQVKNLLLDGLSQYKIADMFSVSRGTIQDIKKGKTWKDI